MKKILLLAQNYYPEIGSAANRITNMANELQALGHEVTVLTMEPSYPNRNMYKDSRFWEQDKPPYRVIRLKMRTRKYSHNLYNRLLLYTEMMYKFIRTVRRLNPEYDYILASTPAIFVGMAGMAAKKRLKCPLILDVRDLWPDSLLGTGAFNHRPIIFLAGWIEKRIYRAAKHIVVNSEGFKPHIVSKGIEADKISFMPNSLNNKDIEAKPSLHKDNEALTVVYTGNVGLAQDLDIFLKAAELMSKRRDVNFKIMGYGYRYKELKDRVNQAGMDNLEIIDASNKKEAVEAVNQADIAFVSLIPQRVFDKVLPGKIVDYMSMGKPIIGAVSGYSADLILQAKCGFVSEARDPIAIVEFIEKLLASKELRMNLGRSGYEYALQHFQWQRNISILDQILENDYEQENLHVRLEPLYK